MTAQLVSLSDVLGAAAKEEGQHKSQDLSASLAAQTATTRILSLLGSETFDQGSYEDTFFVDEESGRASDILTFKLANGLVDSGQSVTVKTSTQMDSEFTTTTAPVKVLYEKGHVRMRWNPNDLADVFVKISYTAGLATGTNTYKYAGQQDLVETVYENVPSWLKDLAIGRAILQMVVSGAIQRGKDKSDRSPILQLVLGGPIKSPNQKRDRSPIDRLMALDDDILAQHQRFETNAFKPVF